MREPSDPNYDRIDHDIRVNELKIRAEDAAGGALVAWEADEAPPGIVESFWENVVAYEEAPDTSTREILRKDGIELPPSEGLDDAALTATLWDLIHALEKRNTDLSSTDHLSDRELYIHLTEDSLDEITKDFFGIELDTPHRHSRRLLLGRHLSASQVLRRRRGTGPLVAGMARGRNAGTSEAPVRS